MYRHYKFGCEHDHVCAFECWSKSHALHKQRCGFLLHPITTTSTTAMLPTWNPHHYKPWQLANDQTQQSHAHITSINNNKYALHVAGCHVTQPPPQTTLDAQNMTTTQSTTTYKEDSEQQMMASTQHMTSTTQQPLKSPNGCRTTISTHEWQRDQHPRTTMTHACMASVLWTIEWVSGSMSSQSHGKHVTQTNEGWQRLQWCRCRHFVFLG